MELLLFLAPFAWLLCGIICASIASSKHRSGCGWFILGALFGPLALLFVAAASSEKQEYDDREYKICPHCAEEILIDAVKCRYCGEALPGLEEIEDEPEKPRPDNWASRFFGPTG